jgi:hypothetical protein
MTTNLNDQKVYTIRDSVADYFLPPFVAQTDDQASRMFIGSLGDSFPYRSGFMLYHVADFSSESGLFTAREPTLVLAGSSVNDELDPRPRPLHKENAQ